MANGKETIIKRNLAKASPAHWRFGLQSSNLAPHVGGTGRLNGSKIAQIDSDGGRLSIVTMSLAVTVVKMLRRPFIFWFYTCKI